MEADQVTGSALDYILVRPAAYQPGDAYPVVVLLHGFGASMYDLANVAPAIDAEGYLYFFPNAPYEVHFGGGQVGYSWRTDRPGIAAPDPGDPTTEQRLDAFFEEILARDGVEAGKIVLGGFSQGGGLTLTYGLTRPETFPGLACLSGLLRTAELDNLPADRTQRIFIAHGTYDPMIDVGVARTARQFLEERGYAPEYHEYPMAHQIAAEELDDLRPWLHTTLPPKATPQP
jgi:phospholipase/carboxylesterase